MNVARRKHITYLSFEASNFTKKNYSFIGKGYTLKFKNLFIFTKQIDSKAKIMVFPSFKCCYKQKEAYTKKKKP